MTSKDDLRTDLQKRRQVFVDKRQSSDFETASEAHRSLLARLERCGSLAGYAPLRGEPDIAELLRQIAVGRPTALPYMDCQSSVMAFRTWAPGDALERSPFGFRQPLAAAPLLIPDAILVPLIGFDRDLNRLGHGKGHYDRALVQLPRAVTIGIAWSVQEVAAIPADPWDIRLDAVATEREWIVRA